MGRKLSIVPGKPLAETGWVSNVNDSEAPLGVLDGKAILRVIVDRMSIEVSANDGAVQICRNLVPAHNPTCAVKVFGKKGLADAEVNVYLLQSIWNKK